MSQTSMEIIMSEDLKERLLLAAGKHGKTVQEFAQEALYTYVEDIEDGVLSDVALADEGLTYLLPEREVSGGLDHSVFEAGRKTA
jgi:predicted DNA-binding protein